MLGSNEQVFSSFNAMIDCDAPLFTMPEDSAPWHLCEPESAPLSILAGEGLGGRFRFWRGASGRRFMFSVYASLQNEQELDLPHFIKFGNVNTVTQQHARASEANIQIMQAFGVQPTVLVRNIFLAIARNFVCMLALVRTGDASNALLSKTM